MTDPSPQAPVAKRSRRRFLRRILIGVLVLFVGASYIKWLERDWLTVEDVEKMIDVNVKPGMSRQDVVAKLGSGRTLSFYKVKRADNTILVYVSKAQVHKARFFNIRLYFGSRTVGAEFRFDDNDKLVDYGVSADNGWQATLTTENLFPLSDD